MYLGKGHDLYPRYSRGRQAGPPYTQQSLSRDPCWPAQSAICEDRGSRDDNAADCVDDLGSSATSRRGFQDFPPQPDYSQDPFVHLKYEPYDPADGLRYNSNAQNCGGVGSGGVGGWRADWPGCRDDDDRTTTSGSYTLNPDDLRLDMDDVFYQDHDVVV